MGKLKVDNKLSAIINAVGVLTSSMVTSLCVIHHEGVWLRRCLLFQPVPFVIRIVRQIVYFSHIIWYDSIGGDEVGRINRATIAECKGAVFKDWYEGTPCTTFDQ